MVQIVQLEEVPADLLELVRVETQDLDGVVDGVVFGAFMEHMNGTVGTFVPNTKTVYIDMGNALTQSALFNAGMMFIPNVWYTIIWALGHELEHACQLEAKPELIEYAKLPQEYENLATEVGSELVLRWSHHHTIPPLNQLGWLSKQLVVMLNAMYSKHPDVADEADQYPLGAAAQLEAVFANWEFTDKGKEVLIQEIDAGNIGVKVGNDRFLTAYEFFGL